MRILSVDFKNNFQESPSSGDLVAGNRAHLQYNKQRVVFSPPQGRKLLPAQRRRRPYTRIPPPPIFSLLSAEAIEVADMGGLKAEMASFVSLLRSFSAASTCASLAA